MDKSTIIFLINPKSGHKRKVNEQIIRESFGEFKVIVYDKINGRDEFIQENIAAGIENFAVAGGDGTVNEVAQVLVNTPAKLGIIPSGSGNGLARSLNIPMDVLKSFEIIKKGKTKKIDVGFLDEKPFFCTAGLGFDAVCAFDFAQGTHSRGLKNYLKVILKNFFKFKPIAVEINDQPGQYFSVTFANAPQYGNDAFISPLSKLDDGIIECSLIHQHPKIYGPLIGYRLLNKSLHHSAYYESISQKHFTVSQISDFRAHIDGEPVRLENSSIKISILEKALNVIIP